MRPRDSATAHSAQRPAGDTRPILFCVPHAGGSATVFLQWRELLSDLVDVVPIELSGRGVRMSEPLKTSAQDSGADVAVKMCEHLAAHGSGRDYLIWGHSMGSLVAYEAYHALRRMLTDRADAGTGPIAEEPAHIVFSGRTPPHVDVETNDYYLLRDDDEFIDAVDTYGGGTAATLRASQELREMFLPILRADFEVSETYEWTAPEDRIRSRVTILNGADDVSVSSDKLGAWQDLVALPITEMRAPGGHFFLYEQDDLVRQVVQSALSPSPGHQTSTTGKAPQ